MMLTYFPRKSDYTLYISLKKQKRKKRKLHVDVDIFYDIVTSILFIVSSATIVTIVTKHIYILLGLLL